MILCIEQSPPKNEVISCTICKTVCLSGQRRKDPFGSFYCSKCGGKIQSIVRKKVEQNQTLAYFVSAIPGFLRYCPPDLIGLRSIYREIEFSYQPVPDGGIKHKARPRNFPTDCVRCNCRIPFRRSASRRGFNVNATYCATCGLNLRRAASRIRNSEMLLKKMYLRVPSVKQFLRADVLSWLETTATEVIEIRL